MGTGIQWVIICGEEVEANAIEVRRRVWARRDWGRVFEWTSRGIDGLGTERQRIQNARLLSSPNATINP